VVIATTTIIGAVIVAATTIISSTIVAAPWGGAIGYPSVSGRGDLDPTVAATANLGERYRDDERQHREQIN
jgi:hypothetical protein